jgi:hypothetical protein
MLFATEGDFTARGLIGAAKLGKHCEAASLSGRCRVHTGSNNHVHCVNRIRTRWSDTPVQRVFLLSPAKVSGARAGLLLNPAATFALARQFHREGLSLGEIFTFASGLYFRGKLTYASRFASPQKGELVRVITSNRGLIDPAEILRPEELRAFGDVDINESDPRYQAPLLRDATMLAQKLPANGVAILLGSIATAKYRDVLLQTFGPRLVFPEDFVGRGDMSRGGLLLRAVREGHELTYARVSGAVLKGKRAPRIGDMPIKPQR